MCKAIYDIRMEGVEEGKILGLVSAYTEMGLSIQEIAIKTNLSEDDVKRYQDEA